MKFNKLAQKLGFSVTELAEKVKEIIPDANGGTEVDETQEKAIRALVTNRKTFSQEAHSSRASGDTNELFETAAPSDTDLGIAVLSGMLEEYDHRIRGLTIAHNWINRHEETGDYPDSPVAAKLTEAICLLRSLNIPYQPSRPAIKQSGSSASSEGSGVSLPPMVRSLLATAYPSELTDLDRDLPKSSEPDHLQLSAGQ